MKQTYEDFLGRKDIQFWVPIIIYCITLTAAFFGLKGDIREIAVELKNHDVITQTFITKTQNLTIAVNDLASRTIILETKLNK